jgi:transposase
VVALRTPGLRAVAADDATVALRLLVDRRDELGAARTLTVNRLHRLRADLVPGGAKKDLTARQARDLLARIRPRDVVGKTRRGLAAELVAGLEAVDKKIKTATKQLTELVEATGSRLLDLYGVGPSGAARLLGDIGDPARFPTRGHVASWNSRRAVGRLLRRPAAAPPLPRREPADQPRPAHHGHRPAPPRHPRPGLLPAEDRRR